MVRTRYAPSPSGTLHIGGARTALFSFLFAKHHGGDFVLRVEDTDRARLVSGSEEALMRSMESLGILWDEGPDVGGPYGPYRQSERLVEHQRYAAQLLDEGKAYRCYCTPEELDAARKARQAQGLPPRYMGTCRKITVDDPIHQTHKPYVLRLKIPLSGVTVVDDMIRGHVSFDNAILDDFVIVKTDGTPTYNFAVVIDDWAMHISHVIRAEEHLSNTPKQILVYEALNFSLPQFAHIPMVLAPDRSKLSKRHGATSVEEYAAQGILPEALANYLLLLGWSAPDGREFMTVADAIPLFSLDRVQHTAAVYDQKKLEWMNAQYLKSLPVTTVAQAVRPFVEKLGITVEHGPSLEEGVELVRERAHTLQDLAEGMRFLWQNPEEYDAKGVDKHFSNPEVVARLQALAETMQQLSKDQWHHDGLVQAFDQLATQLGIKRAELIHPCRLALTGRTVGPGLFELVVVLGQEETVARLLTVATALSRGALQLEHPIG
ncbi:MAG: glutamate--tRNA ligase [Sulfobacillus sp.]